jgi:nucleoside-diphosphate-sugar epimerase
MNLLVFGANGPTGRLLVEQALAEGHEVTAFTRRPDSYPLEHERLSVVEGDVLDADSVDSVMAGHHAVLSVLGVPYGKQPIHVYSKGLANIIAAMRHHGVNRVVCVSSSATDPSAGPHGGFFFEKVLQPFVINVMGKTLYDDMKRMETLVRESELDWTIVRPSGLFDAETVSDYVSAETYTPGAFTARTDLANCVLRQATDGRYSRKIVAVATSQGAPSVFQLMMKEALPGKKAA